MKFKIVKTMSAQKEFNSLSIPQKIILNLDYKKIEQKGIEFVKRRSLGDGLFEIKTRDMRSLYRYEEDCLLLVSVIYQKKTRKTPKHIINLAHSRFSKEILK